LVLAVQLVLMEFAQELVIVQYLLASHLLAVEVVEVTGMIQ
jgi:hypothetical protein